MPSASENASEIATVRIPPITARRRFVAALNPIMTPSVVMTPDVIPNAIPVFTNESIGFLKIRVFIMFMRMVKLSSL